MFGKIKRSKRVKRQFDKLEFIALLCDQIRLHGISVQAILIKTVIDPAEKQQYFRPDSEEFDKVVPEYT